MNFKGTKGKWEIYGISDEIIELYSIDNTKPVFDIITHTNNTESRANALLISKAPEMLEMLKQIVKENDSSMVPGIDTLKIRSLISKATEL